MSGLALLAGVALAPLGCRGADDADSASAAAAAEELHPIDLVFVYTPSMKSKVEQLKKLPQLSRYFGYEGSLDDRQARIDYCVSHTCALVSTNVWSPFIAVGDDEDPLAAVLKRLASGELKLRKGPAGMPVHLGIVVASDRDTEIAESVFHDSLARYGLSTNPDKFRDQVQGDVRYHVFAQTCRSDEQKQNEAKRDAKSGFVSKILPKNLEMIAGRSGGLTTESCNDAPDLSEWSKALHDLSIVAEGGIDVARCPLLGPELALDDARELDGKDTAHTSVAPECRLTPVNVDGKTSVKDDFRSQWCQLGSCGRTGDATCAPIGERSRTIRFQGPKGDVCQKCTYYESVCGSHSTCRGHDACYFRCYDKYPYSDDEHSPFNELGRCILKCDLWAVGQSGLAGIRWAMGVESWTHPYDKWLPYSTGPIGVEQVSCDGVPKVAAGSK